MKCKHARAMIERVTPAPTFDPFQQGAIFPWSNNCLDPYSIAEYRRDKRVLAKAKRRVAPSLWEHVNGLLVDFCCGGEFKIVRVPEGRLEDNPLDPDTGIGEVYVDERENGGISGDSYSGYAYVKITRLDYLKFYYSM